MSTHFLLLVIISFVTLIIITINKKMGNSVFVPPVFLFLNVTINLFFGILFIDFQYNVVGVFYLLAMVVVSFALSIPILSLLNENKRETKNTAQLYFKSELSRKIVIVIFIIALLSPIYSVLKNGISIQNLFNFQELINYNATVAKSRYSGSGSSGGAINSLLLITVYAAPMIGGTHKGLFQKQKIGYITLIPSILTVLLTNTKAGMIASVVVFICGWIIGQIIKVGKPVINLKNFLLSIIAGLMLLVFLIFSMLLRIGNFSQQMVFNIWEKFVMYAFGDVPAFNSWLMNHQISSFGFGENLFIGLFNMLGLSERVQGLYTDVVYLPSSGLVTNVFSAFRALILDFSWFGGILFIGIFTIISTFSFFKVKNGENVAFYGFILMNFYFFTVYSKFTSIWTYSSYIFALVLYGVYLAVIIKKDNNWEK
ncbi:O-antigen polymerase [Leuconostoc lactis]|uniref:O-antigen polymerase n=1 Tax=Leuconostoc lactis TaxID=1246 RepID=UPI0024AE2A57|nr:O-antigen polymerase [Leuconostoc lactis]MDI6572592.1 O-antigen polymerase [Leuconostoc lactis]